VVSSIEEEVKLGRSVVMFRPESAWVGYRGPSLAVAGVAAIGAWTCAEVTCSTRVTPDEVLVAVHDCGPGIPEALAATMFEPFVTTKPDGLGMGLFIVRSIAEAHGGRAFAGNDPDGGAIVGLALRRLGAA